MNQAPKVEMKLFEMASRIRELRDITGFTAEEMAERTGVSVQEYLDCEAGRADLSFAFLYLCAQALRVDVTDIIEGASPRLSSYTLTRRGGGQRIERAHGMIYYNLAPFFKKRIAEPLCVTAGYHDGAEEEEIELTTHAGQECDIVIRGKLKVQVGEHKMCIRDRL